MIDTRKFIRFGSVADLERAWRNANFMPDFGYFSDFVKF
jgi:hypothetical protein